MRELRRINGELLTQDQAETRQKQVAELLDYARSRYGCCGALHDFRHKIYNCKFARLQEYVKQMIRWRNNEPEPAEEITKAVDTGNTSPVEDRVGWKQLIDNPFSSPVTGEQA